MTRMKLLKLLLVTTIVKNKKIGYPIFQWFVNSMYIEFYSDWVRNMFSSSSDNSDSSSDLAEIDIPWAMNDV